jgi:hypothetical protein
MKSKATRSIPIDEYLARAHLEAVMRNTYQPFRPPPRYTQPTIGTVTLPSMPFQGRGFLHHRGHVSAIGAPIHPHHPNRRSDPYSEGMFTSQLPLPYKDARHLAHGGTLFL